MEKPKIIQIFTDYICQNGKPNNEKNENKVCFVL